MASLRIYDNGKNMKKRVIGLGIALFLLAPVIASGIDFVWRDEKGGYYYECGGHVVGGRARVKAEGKNLYRVEGVRINRVIRASSVYHAAQIVCGEKPEMDEDQEQSSR